MISNLVTPTIKPCTNLYHVTCTITKEGLTIKCCLWNVLSLLRKLPKVMEHIIDSDPEIVFFTETWLQSEKNSVTAEVKTFGYKLIHDPRKDCEKEQGGVVCIMVRDSVVAKHLPA